MQSDKGLCAYMCSSRLQRKEIGMQALTEMAQRRELCRVARVPFDNQDSQHLRKK